MNIEKKDNYDLIIIGSGPTGLYATYYACLKGLNVLMIESSTEYGGAPAKLYPDKPLYDIPGHCEITGMELVSNMYKQLEQFKTWQLKTSIFIVEIKKDNNGLYILLDKDNKEYKTKNILFATGYGSFEFIGFEFELDHKILNHIHHFVKDAKAFKNKNVIICGGGDSAIDYANFLSNIARSICLIHRRQELRAKQANVEKASKKINMHLNYSIHKIDNKHIHIKHNEKTHEAKIEYDEIIVLYGTKLLPNNIKIENLFNNVHKIDVDQNYQALHWPGIYACGSANTNKQQQTIITGIADAIRAIEHMININKTKN